MVTDTYKRYPTERDEKRRALLQAVEDVRDTVVAQASASEALGTLAPAAVDALRNAGLFALKLPAELGGAEADPVTQMEVIEALVYHDTSAAWAMMICATSVGWPGAFLPQAGIDTLFAGGRVPLVAGSGGVGGRAEVVDGGYRVQGRYPFASGARHADYLIAGAPIVRDGEPAEMRSFVVPVDQATIHLESWDVAGLRGTGSCDFSLNDVFVPEAQSWDRAIMAGGKQERGGPIFSLGMPAFTANEVPAFALGGARRALDLITALAMSKRRGRDAITLIGERPVFQRFVAESELRLKAARALLYEGFEAAWQTVSAGRLLDARTQAELRAAGVYATDVTVDIVMQAFRFAGGGALQTTSPLQRYWRDITAASQHQAVSNAAYEVYGQHLLGIGVAEAAAGGGNARA